MLASLEEIIDWQPFEHAGYRVTVPDLGPIEATYDLTEDSQRASTTIRHRWTAVGAREITGSARRRLARDREVAFERLKAP